MSDRLRPAGLALAWLIFCGFGGPAHEGAALQKSQEYQAALESYKKAQLEDPENRSLDYNMGGVYHKLGQFEEAAKSFGRAAGADDPALGGNALFNQGVSLFRAGEVAQGSGDGSQAQKLYSAAAESFKNSLRIDRADKDSRHNLELALARLKEVESQKQRQKQDQSEQNDKDNKEQQENKPDKGDQKQDKKDQQDQSGKKEDDKQEEQRDNKPNQKEEEMDKGREMTPEEAKLTLDAIEKDEMELKKSMRQKMMPPTRRPEKDW
ncbi:MAG: tetratricopeptide repeat protein [Nitrospinota bacterium]|nr:tetratricopeptide repeat protein [Nitrospinota bacterium]